LFHMDKGYIQELSAAGTAWHASWSKDIEFADVTKRACTNLITTLSKILSATVSGVCQKNFGSVSNQHGSSLALSS